MIKSFEVIFDIEMFLLYAKNIYLFMVSLL